MTVVRTNSLSRFRDDPIGFLRSLAGGGDFVPFRMARRRFTLVNHPDLIQSVLVTRQADFEKGPGLLRARPLLGDGLVTAGTNLHRIHRRIVQPAFWRSMIDEYRAAMTEAIAGVEGRWPEGRRLDWHREMARLTLTVSGKALFGDDFSQAAESVADDMAAAIDFGYRRLSAVPSRPGDGIEGSASKMRSNAALSAIRARLEDLALASVVHPEPAGLLASLLRGALLDGELSALEVADEGVTFLIASHEAVANALTWTTLLLVANPACEARLCEEIAADTDQGPAARAETASPPSDEGQPARLPYTRAVISESLRLYPPAWMISRQAVRDTEIGGHAVAAGEIMIISQAVMHRDPRYFADPDRFDPERWLRPERAAVPQGAYIPFGDGARGCIGEMFARQEMTIALAAFARRWRIRPETPLPLPVQALVTLRPAGPVWVTLTKR